LQADLNPPASGASHRVVIDTTIHGITNKEPPMTFCTDFHNSTTGTIGFAETVEHLRDRTTGDVLTPADPGYAAACAAWNLTFTHHPFVVVVAESVDDIVEAVRFARAGGFRVAVQATGHGVARPADGAVLIVTSRLTDVTIDRDEQTAYVSAGAKWGAVLAPAQEHGLAPLLGSTTDVGAIGYTLGGGMGWLGRRYGLASDSVHAFDLVTPEGVAIRASRRENQEIFWALKGGGGGTFGVVTGMEIELYPVSTVYAGNLLYPIEMAKSVMTRWREWVSDMDERMSSAVVLMNFPPIDVVPEPLRGNSFVMVRGCWSGDLADGQALIDDWRRWSEPALDMFGPMPFAMADMISQDPVDPMPGTVTTEWFDTLADEAMDILIDATAPKDGPPLLLFTEIRHAGGAIRTNAIGVANARGRSGEFLCHFGGLVMGPEMGAALKAAMEATRARLAPYVNGSVYINFLEGAEKQERTHEAYDRAAFARLGEIKAEVDADNRFCHGFAIAPATA
jgi:hypothetical protein